MTEILTAEGEIAHTIEIGKATYTLAAKQYEASLGQALAGAASLPSNDHNLNERYAQLCTCAQILGHNAGILSALDVLMMTEEATLGYITSMTHVQIAKRFPEELQPQEVDAEVSTFLETTGIAALVSTEYESGFRIGRLFLDAIQSEYATSTDSPES